MLSRLSEANGSNTLAAATAAGGGGGGAGMRATTLMHNTIVAQSGLLSFIIILGWNLAQVIFPLLS